MPVTALAIGFGSGIVHATDNSIIFSGPPAPVGQPDSTKQTDDSIFAGPPVPIEQPTPGRAVKAVIIDDWWDADYVCFPDPMPCPHKEEVVEVRKFENDIVSAFVSDESCQGLSIGIFGGPFASKDLDPKQDHWALTIDFHSDRQSQRWTAVSRNELELQGNSGAVEIAKRICAAITGRGASKVR
jgi:hypothetical protein